MIYVQQYCTSFSNRMVSASDSRKKIHFFASFYLNIDSMSWNRTLETNLWIYSIDIDEKNPFCHCEQTNRWICFVFWVMQLIGECLVYWFVWKVFLRIFVVPHILKYTEQISCRKRNGIENIMIENRWNQSVLRSFLIRIYIIFFFLLVVVVLLLVYRTFHLHYESWFRKMTLALLNNKLKIRLLQMKKNSSFLFR